MTSDNPSTTKKPGRKTETPAQRLARLEREMQLARQAVKEHRQRVLASIGEALIDEAKAHPEFMEKLRDALTRRVKNKAALASANELLGE